MLTRLGRPACTVILFMLQFAGAAGAELRIGEEKLLHGDYAAAIQEFSNVTGKDAGTAALRLGTVLLRTGDFAGAEAAARRAGTLDGQVLLAEVKIATGRMSEAQALLEEVARKQPKHLRARCRLGWVYLETGAVDQAERTFEQFFDDWENGAIDENNPEELLYVAIAARYLGSYEDANDTFREAVAKDPHLFDANLEWGLLFLDKYAAGYAEQSFEEVLKIDPNHPDAHVGMARVRLEQNYDVRGAVEHLGHALSVSANHAGALVVRAEIEIDNTEYAVAERTVTQVLKQNPFDLPARSLLAAIHWLRDEKGKYQDELKEIFRKNPKYARVYHVVAEHAVKVHRYREAITLEEEALRVDPEFYEAMAGIGTGYLRLAEEKKGLEYLGRAFEGDKYNVRTYNLLNLFEEVIPKDYVFITAPHFRIRMPGDERPVLERYLPALLERAFADMVKRYGFAPQTPVTVELYGDPDQYSVRTIGLPNLGALGVCFGQVITALSPANGKINWGMVLWHELGHVFAIQLSGSRVPRWFTEGLSEYETVIARPEWRRENDADVWIALSTNRLPSVTELGSRFTRARNMNDMVVAYHMSSLVIEFMAKRWGFPKILEALRLFGKGKGTEEVLRDVTRLDVTEFDAQFRRFLAERLRVYQGTFALRLEDFEDLSLLEKAAAARPRDADLQAELALGYLVADDLPKAGAALRAALALDAKNKKALFASAELSIRNQDRQNARDRLKELIAAGGDGYDTRLRLATIAFAEKDLKTAAAELAVAKRLDPERSEPYRLLAEAYGQSNREDDALKELEKLVYLEQMEYAPARKLSEVYSSRQIWPKVREFGELALLINPYDAELHLMLANAYLALTEHDRAISEYESALLVKPPLRRPAVAKLGLARAYLAKKARKQASELVDQALELEPEFAEALELQRQLAETPRQQ